MDRKLCDCPNDLPVKVLSDLPPRPNRMTEPHFKIGGKTSPGRFSRHFYQMFPERMGEDERSDGSHNDDNNYYYFSSPLDTPTNSNLRPSLMRSSSLLARLTLSPVVEHPTMVNDSFFHE